MKTSPTQRSLAELRKRGMTCAVVEKWNPHAKIRQDLFGVIDVLAIHPMLSRTEMVPIPGAPDWHRISHVVGIAGVQATTASNLAARRTKSLAEPRLRVWLEAGGRFFLHGWSKKGARGKAKRWTLREEEITLADLPAETMEHRISREEAAL